MFDLNGRPRWTQTSNLVTSVTQKDNNSTMKDTNTKNRSAVEGSGIEIPLNKLLVYFIRFYLYFHLLLIFYVDFLL